MELNERKENLLLKLIDIANGTNLSDNIEEIEENCKFSLAENYAELFGFNSKVSLDALTSSLKYEGNQEFYYNRILLTELITKYGNTITIPANTTVAEFVPLLNTKFNIALTPSDFVDLDTVTEGQNILTINPGHLVFKGSMALEVTIAPSTKINLEDLLPVQVLDGFTLP